MGICLLNLGLATPLLNSVDVCGNPIAVSTNTEKAEVLGDVSQVYSQSKKN